MLARLGSSLQHFQTVSKSEKARSGVLGPSLYNKHDPVVKGSGKIAVPHYVGFVEQGDAIGEDCLTVYGAMSTTQVY